MLVTDCAQTSRLIGKFLRVLHSWGCFLNKMGRAILDKTLSSVLCLYRSDIALWRISDSDVGVYSQQWQMGSDKVQYCAPNQDSKTTTAGVLVVAFFIQTSQAIGQTFQQVDHLFHRLMWSTHSNTDWICWYQHLVLAQVLASVSVRGRAAVDTDRGTARDSTRYAAISPAAYGASARVTPKQGAGNTTKDASNPANKATKQPTTSATANTTANTSLGTAAHTAGRAATDTNISAAANATGDTTTDTTGHATSDTTADTARHAAANATMGTAANIDGHATADTTGDAAASTTGDTTADNAGYPTADTTRHTVATVVGVV